MENTAEVENNDKPDSTPTELNEVKTKKPGFFKRLKRRVSSVFQRKTTRKRTKSESCLPDVNAISHKLDTHNEQPRLSLTTADNDDADKSADSADPDSFRPPTKAPIFVNDFTAELKKSLKQRSKMVEEGQASNAIFQIEMSRSNYSVGDDDAQQKATEKKTFEEKLALFESQISGGSHQNSLGREAKTGPDGEPLSAEDEDKVDAEAGVDKERDEGEGNAGIDKERNEGEAGIDKERDDVGHGKDEGEGDAGIDKERDDVGHGKDEGEGDAGIDKERDDVGHGKDEGEGDAGIDKERDDVGHDEGEVGHEKVTTEAAHDGGQDKEHEEVEQGKEGEENEVGQDKEKDDGGQGQEHTEVEHDKAGIELETNDTGKDDKDIEKSAEAEKEEIKNEVEIHENDKGEVANDSEKVENQEEAEESVPDPVIGCGMEKRSSQLDSADVVNGNKDGDSGAHCSSSQIDPVNHDGATPTAAADCRERLPNGNAD